MAPSTLAWPRVVDTIGRPAAPDKVQIRSPDDQVCPVISTELRQRADTTTPPDLYGMLRPGGASHENPLQARGASWPRLLN
jgi:hypothetical protein